MKDNFQNMTIHQICLEMAKLGWEAEQTINGRGWTNDKPHYIIRFSRWNWHGKWCDRRQSAAYAKSLDEADILIAVKYAANRACKAWEDYPDSLPYMNGTDICPEDEYIQNLFKQGKLLKAVTDRLEVSEELEVIAEEVGQVARVLNEVKDLAYKGLLSALRVAIALKKLKTLHKKVLAFDYKTPANCPSEPVSEDHEPVK